MSDPSFANRDFSDDKRMSSAAAELQKDEELKRAISELKDGFMNNTQALLHGDLHTGSIMLNESVRTTTKMLRCVSP